MMPKAAVACLMLIAIAGCSVTPSGRLGSEPADMPGSQPTDMPGYFREVIGDRVLFDSNESLITAEAAIILDGQADWLIDNPSRGVIIEGHADERGTREYNLGLGARRASSVRDYLVARGVTENRILTATFGKERPAATCSDESCWSVNRRAVTTMNPSVSFRGSSPGS